MHVYVQYAGYCTADCRFLFYLLSVCDLLCSFVYMCIYVVPSLIVFVLFVLPSLLSFYLYIMWHVFVSLPFLSICSSLPLPLSPSLPVFSWCSLLSDASLQALEYYYDLQFYWKKGNSLQL